MKRLFFLLFTLLLPFLTWNPVQALKVDIQVERTPQVPGYLSFTVFPPKDRTKSDSMVLDEVYIKNYPQGEAAQYQELIALIQEFGGKVVPALQAPQWYRRPYTRVIVLGENENVEGDLYFSPEAKDFENLTEHFVAFAEKALRPSYLQSISIATEDDNLTDIYPEVVSFLGDEPIQFVGKFKDAQSIEVILQAIGPQEILQAKIAADIPHISLLNTDLPEAWESLQKSIKNTSQSHFWFNFFPIFLGILGVICLIFALKMKQKETPEDDLHHAVGQLHRDIHKDTMPFDMDQHHKEPIHKVKKTD